MVSNKSFEKSQNMPKEPHKKLNAHDVAFGIGLVATDEELKEYLGRPVGKFKDSKKLFKIIFLMHLTAKFAKKCNAKIAKNTEF